jgi:hypothetical protein
MGMWGGGHELKCIKKFLSFNWKRLSNMHLIQQTTPSAFVPVVFFFFFLLCLSLAINRLGFSSLQQPNQQMTNGHVNQKAIQGKTRRREKSKRDDSLWPRGKWVRLQMAEGGRIRIERLLSIRFHYYRH